MDEIVYEIDMDDENEEGLEEMEEGEHTEMEEDMTEMDENMEEMEESMVEPDFQESYNHEKIGVKEAKMTTKPVGKGIGKPDFKYDGETTYKSPKKMKQGTKGVGMGKPKFEYKEGENTDGKMKMVKNGKKKVEAKYRD